MANLLDLQTTFADKKLHLGYRKFKPKTNFFWSGTLLGHEFHYTSAIHQAGNALFDVEDADGNKLGSTGLKNNNVSGSYGHVIALQQ